MNSIDKLVKERRSVRTFEEREIAKADMDALLAYMEDIQNPYGVKVVFKVLDAGERRLSCPVVVGTDLYVGAKVKNQAYMNEAVGYSFEKLILFAQSLGIGTVWIGGTMDRGAFEKAMELEKDEVMPCVSPIGYPSKKMSIRETLMRKGIKADDRVQFDKLFCDGDFSSSLTEEKAGTIAHALQMVRLAPSAVNKQPWRVVVKDNKAHFYLARAKGFGGAVIDMQKIDLGIALCHFELAAKEDGVDARFEINDPGIDVLEGIHYIASYAY